MSFNLRKRKFKILILGIAITLIAILIFIYFYSFSVFNNKLEVHFLDVGQGDAVLIKTPFGQNVLLDGGPDNKALTEIEDCLPWWDKTIDLMILSHPHDDHITGLVEVLKRYKVKNILYSGAVVDSPVFLSWLNLIKEKNISLIRANFKQKLVLGDNCFLKVFYPLENLWEQEIADLNNSSLVIKLECSETKFLFAGDIEEPVEEKLLQEYCIPHNFSNDIFYCQPSDLNFSLQADFFKANHHGSDTSNTEDFLHAVNPSFAVIQVGAENKFGHPGLRVLRRFSDFAINVYRNDLDGRVSIIIEAGLPKIKTSTP